MSWRLVRVLFNDTALCSSLRSTDASQDNLLQARIASAAAAAAPWDRCAVAARSRTAAPPLQRLFRIERFNSEMRDAFVMASARAHPLDHHAAQALDLADGTFRDWLADRPVPPRSNTADLLAGPCILWVARDPPPDKLARAAESCGTRFAPREPGDLHPRDLAEPTLQAAIVHVDCVLAAVDAWVLYASRVTVPFVICCSQRPELRFLLARLPMDVAIVHLDDLTSVLPQIVAAGRSASHFHDLAASCLCTPQRDASQWILPLRRVLREVENDVLQLARSTHRTKVAAAAAVGLPRYTYDRRLAEARRGY